MKYLKILFLTLLTFVMVNCATEETITKDRDQNEETRGNNNEEIPRERPRGEPQDGLDYGAKADLKVSSNYIFSRYLGGPINKPRNIQVHVNLVDMSGGYGGQVTISYEREINGVYEPRQTTFATGGDREAIKFNKWFSVNRDDKFHAIFEEDPPNVYGGALVLVIDSNETIDDGDGGMEDIEVGGSIWFKNYFDNKYDADRAAHTFYNRRATYCWFVYDEGPYDCRPWPDGKGMDKNPPVEPTSASGYTRLGRFSGLSLTGAFNDDEIRIE